MIRTFRPALLALAVVLPVAASAAAPGQTAPSPAPAPATSPARQVVVTTLTAGQGAKPTREDYVLVNYKGMLKDGTVFDQNEQMPMALGEVVPGFADGLVQMQRGGSYRILIPAELAYGAEGGGPIPPNSDLVFEVTLLDFKTRAELDAMIAAQQGQAQPAQPGSQ
ncbi:FKBP-type peptidyl-prolyl cis-trans isomerase [Novosphingobium sp. ST904]|uniref:FKBP-type peptidyl-prolyl cis-trans isomerase n=1 Tax=Novosphingobium sp. ST904 TaxID=1684385 RepID=UPI0006C84663|nr:FKBP-type peptidyl-prolyl cis-trans isomerase [Novosphingobium sp. ST904]KPH59586.1 peptidylprolyl isomerase [Novosphingobium sp. ST904]TCM38040.1 FKBP-type peptidyl-prolyl cis-trans isomerase [Novosphingobium sp. ST904]